MVSALADCSSASARNSATADRSGWCDHGARPWRCRRCCSSSSHTSDWRPCRPGLNRSECRDSSACRLSRGSDGCIRCCTGSSDMASSPQRGWHPKAAAGRGYGACAPGRFSGHRVICEPFSPALDCIDSGRSPLDPRRTGSLPSSSVLLAVCTGRGRYRSHSMRRSRRPPS
jgi:hypothetical protein